MSPIDFDERRWPIIRLIPIDDLSSCEMRALGKIVDVVLEHKRPFTAVIDCTHLNDPSDKDLIKLAMTQVDFSYAEAVKYCAGIVWVCPTDQLERLAQAVMFIYPPVCRVNYTKTVRDAVLWAEYVLASAKHQPNLDPTIQNYYNKHGEGADDNGKFH